MATTSKIVLTGTNIQNIFKAKTSSIMLEGFMFTLGMQMADMDCGYITEDIFRENICKATKDFLHECDPSTLYTKLP